MTYGPGWPVTGGASRHAALQRPPSGYGCGKRSTPPAVGRCSPGALLAQASRPTRRGSPSSRGDASSGA
eukprot:2817844-Alexandrium_andersonii.AAC.1